jgi:hypothetical protein
VDANRRTASGARPLGPLLFEKDPQALAFYTIQIFNHTHPVVHAISLIQVTKSLTWEARTAGAEIASSRGTIFDSASNASLGLPAVVNSAPGTLVAASQERDTQPAIHPARSDHDVVALHLFAKRQNSATGE